MCFYFTELGQKDEDVDDDSSAEVDSSLLEDSGEYTSMGYKINASGPTKCKMSTYLTERC